MEEIELESTQTSTTAKLPMLKQENGNSFKPVAETITNDAGTSTKHIPGPVTNEEKAQKKNDVKERSMLLVELPNEHLMTFNQYKDAKTLFVAIEIRLGGNEATKKTQKTFLKQLYENFSATSTESLYSIFNRLQKLVIQLVVLGVFFSHEDLNLKFLRSLPSEWNTHVVVWRNKSDLDTMSLDDLYKNFKIVEQEANQPNGSQLVHDYLEQIHEDDLEEIDLKWQLALLSMRAKRWGILQGNAEYQGTRRITKNQETTRRTVNVEDTSSKAMVTSSVKISKPVKENNGAPIIKDWESEGEDEVEYPLEVERKTIEPSVDKLEVYIPKQNEKPAKRPVKYAKMYKTQRPRVLVEALIICRLGTNTIRGEGWEGAKGGNITGKGTIKTGKLDFEDVYFVKELQCNLFSVSQMCDKKNSVLFNDTECFVLSPNFKLADESHVLLKVPRKNNMYSVDMKNIVPKKDLTCLDNLVRGLPLKRFENDQTCVTCLKRKQHKVSFKTKIQNSISQPLFMLHMDLFDPTSNRVMNEFCEEKGIKKEYSVAKTPQQNRVAERRNRILIEAARTMLANFKLSITFWAEAVNTACYVQNKVLVVKPYFMTPYELFKGRTSTLSFMRPFGCHVIILNTLDHLGKFNGKSDEGFFVGYSTNSKAFRVYNTRTRKVEENLHIKFLENKPLIAGDRPKWLFDIDTLTESMNYVPVIAGTNSNDFVGKRASFDAGQSSIETGPSQDYILMLLWNAGSLFNSSSKDSDDGNKDIDGPSTEREIDNQERPNAENSTKDVNIVGTSINTSSSNINIASPTVNSVRQSDDFSGVDNDMTILDGVEVDIGNISATYPVLTTPNTRIHKDYSLDNVIGDIQSSVQTKRMTIITYEQGFISAIYEEKTHKDLHTCLFACFLSQEEPKRITNALKDPAWVEAMQEELL
uniref:Integrase catalytic domain-containing protein n=1 Tax=Tanacetum cinerariifolium TaxID=118510 RepID=A0A6L2MIU3_TANCI|nr:hypothetical protein [Tanacetum cinerariifolium]